MLAAFVLPAWFAPPATPPAAQPPVPSTTPPAPGTAPVASTALPLWVKVAGGAALVAGVFLGVQHMRK